MFRGIPIWSLVFLPPSSYADVRSAQVLSLPQAANPVGNGVMIKDPMLSISRGIHTAGRQNPLFVCIFMIIPGDFNHDSCVFSNTRHKSSCCRRVGCGSNSQPGICGNLVPEKHPSSGFEVAAARDSLLWFHSITVYAHCQLFLFHSLQCFYLFFIIRLSSCRFYRLLGYRPCADTSLQKR